METQAGLSVVVNAKAGRAATDVAERIRAALATAGVAARVERSTGRVEHAVRQAMDASSGLVGIGGGDGTVRAAAQLLAGHRTALAIFPTGTLNHFSRSLGIETVEDAAQAVAAGQRATIGVGEVNDVVFLNTATFGLYSDVLRRRERLRHWIGKWPAALAGFLLTIARYRPVRVVLEVEGRTLVRETALVRVAIGRETFPVATTPPGERLAPVLEIAILRAHTRPALLALGARTFLFALRRRQPANDPAVELLHARRFSIQPHRQRIGVTLDGEIMRIEGVLEVAVRDGALDVIVKPDTE